MTKYQLYCNYSAALRKADQLDQLASQLGRMMRNDFNSEILSVASVWKGIAGGIFRDKAVNLLMQTWQMAEQLNVIANSIRANARAIYNAEIRALEIVQRREY